MDYSTRLLALASQVTVSAHNFQSNPGYQHIAHGWLFAKWPAVFGTTLGTTLCPQHAPWRRHYESCGT